MYHTQSRQTSDLKAGAQRAAARTKDGGAYSAVIGPAG